MYDNVHQIIKLKKLPLNPSVYTTGNKQNYIKF